MDRPIILLTAPDESGRQVTEFTGAAPVREVFKDRRFSAADVEHILSMPFFDVRLKTYLEIRMADSMPESYALSLAALIKGLFYDDDTVDALYATMRELTVDDISRAAESICAAGYGATIYGRPVGELLDEILDYATLSLRKGVAEDADAGDSSGRLCDDLSELAYLSPLSELVKRRATLRDVVGAA
jgi:glutamate--cysteine ligase